MSRKRNEVVGLESLLAGEVAERQALERELRQREERLNGLFNSVPVGLAVVDSSMRYVRVNEALAHINSLPAEEHTGKTIHEVIPGAAPAVEAVIREALTSGRPILNLEVAGEVFNGQGQTRRWLLFFIPLVSAGGDKDGVAVLVYEAGDARQSGPHGREGEAKYGALFEHTSDPVLVSDGAGNLLEVNPRAYRALGYEREEFLRLKLHDLLPGRPAALGPAAGVDRPEGDGVWRRRRVRRRDGSFVDAEVVTSPVGEGKILYVLRFPPPGRQHAPRLPGADAAPRPEPGYEIHLLKDLAAAMSAAVESLEHSPGGAPAAALDFDRGVQFYEEVSRFEGDLIRRALRHAEGNQKRAAESLNINPTTLHAMMKRYDIRPDDFRRPQRRLTVVGGDRKTESA